MRHATKDPTQRASGMEPVALLVGVRPGEQRMIEAINILAALDGVTEHWSPRVVGRVNDQYVKVAKLQGQIAWHRHDDEDELFQIMRGRLRIQFEGGAETALETTASEQSQIAT
ncbi:hypothetical protein [Lichenihabitans psoromatis]|uniref:hypothetical protein n=1 Tax=Lichenihabitans psoromatis TaxID=2528642 RepID=UPI001036D032|nr:hypothetical protein [Lichenihabitans psoromatis]